MNQTPTPTEILLLPLEENDAKASTIGQYLFRLTRKMWNDGEDFSGKRPFGNSAWQGVIAHALILHKYLDGELDENGDIEDYRDSDFDALMNSVFDLLEYADFSSISLPPEPKEWYAMAFDEHDGMVNSVGMPYTREEAEEEAEFRQKTEATGVWRAVRIPKTL